MPSSSASASLQGTKTKPHTHIFSFSSLPHLFSSFSSSFVSFGSFRFRTFCFHFHTQLGNLLHFNTFQLSVIQLSAIQLRASQVKSCHVMTAQFYSSQLTSTQLISTPKIEPILRHPEMYCTVHVPPTCINLNSQLHVFFYLPYLKSLIYLPTYLYKQTDRLVDGSSALQFFSSSALQLFTYYLST